MKYTFNLIHFTSFLNIKKEVIKSSLAFYIECLKRNYEDELGMYTLYMSMTFDELYNAYSRLKKLESDFIEKSSSDQMLIAAVATRNGWDQKII